MQRKLYLINRSNGSVLNTVEYSPFVQGDQEKATRLLATYRDRWYQTSRFADTSLDIKEAM